ncbi:hypothetical protein P4B35_09745 [Pontiellaceae bacterium B12227]|nr:hypothetical protein [Pontiellaceae bacterium B12227]
MFRCLGILADDGLPNICSSYHEQSTGWPKEKMDDWGMTSWGRF